ncbi:hypothetical protein SKAU_G00077350 [Synaphobranchus kaupii]|uniref:C2H2-type domain-containing protein n=1 Tax=Synaphobranchus kaupii TaxID=118154 RepID=A0A9Q1G846_SYNKA|nr:hypothetical protein SKAU_G00077350 [Synaphobranchus kaupii]
MRCSDGAHDRKDSTLHDQLCRIHPALSLRDWWIPQSSLNQISNQSLCFTARALRPASSGEDVKTEPVMDSTDYSGVELRSSLVKSEEIEESIERKNGYGASREEKLIFFNIKEEEEEGGERLREEVKRKDGVKYEEDEVFEWKEEKEREGNEMEQAPKTDRGLNKEGIPEKQEEEGSSSLVTSCLLKQPRVPSPGSPIISSRKGQSEVFACSQCPFSHIEEVKLHQHIEKVHPEEHSSILRTSGNLKSHQRVHRRDCLFHCFQCGKGFKESSALIEHQQNCTGDYPPLSS